MTRFSVEGGKHKFHPRMPELSKKRLKFRANFDSTCLYNLKTKDQADINKLYGLSSLFIHKHSVRFGWRVEGRVIRIFAYWYRKGVRGWADLGTVQPDEWNEYSIEQLPNKFWLFKLNDTEFRIPPIDWCTKYGFKSFPYFGGNVPAPHSMDIGLYEIE